MSEEKRNNDLNSGDNNGGGIGMQVQENKTIATKTTVKTGPEKKKNFRTLRSTTSTSLQKQMITSIFNCRRRKTERT